MPNNDYILRSDALNAIRGTSRWCVDAVEKIPAADVEPVRHGRWVRSDLDYDYVTCSECKRMKLQNRRAWNLNTAEHWGLHYCPNCGAKMDAEPTKENPDDK